MSPFYSAGIRNGAVVYEEFFAEAKAFDSGSDLGGFFSERIRRKKRALLLGRCRLIYPSSVVRNARGAIGGSAEPASLPLKIGYGKINE